MTGGVVELCFGVGPARRLALAPLTGADEVAAAGPDDLLHRLARPGGGLIHGDMLLRMSVGDRDRALAALYRDLYGDRIQADAKCVGCGATYEIRFTLSALVAGRQPDGSAAGDPPVLTVGDSQLRLPQMRDLAEGPEGFLDRLLVVGPVPDAEAAETAIEAADPALELDLAGTCPECGSPQATPFSMAGFLTASLARDRAFLNREVHLIASTYHWSLTEIHSLSRADRQGFARLLIAEREAGAAQMRRVS